MDLVLWCVVGGVILVVVEYHDVVSG